MYRVYRPCSLHTQGIQDLHHHRAVGQGSRKEAEETRGLQAAHVHKRVEEAEASECTEMPHRNGGWWVQQNIEGTDDTERQDVLQIIGNNSMEINERIRKEEQ